MFRIGEVARQLGVCPDRLKKLEVAGLFTAQRDLAGQRRYAREDVQMLHRILFPGEQARRGAIVTDAALAAHDGLSA